MRLSALIATLALSTCPLAVTAETPEERGAYLVEGPAGCGNCHSPIDQAGQPLPGQALAGRLVIELPEFTARAPNITPGGPVAGWSDAELARAIREGLRPDGSLIGPPMPFEMYRDLSDTDLAAIVAYLRTVPAVENTMAASEYRIPLPPAWGPPVESVADIPRGVTAEYGAYLASAVAHCVDCHTPRGPQGALLHDELGRGGFAFEGPWGISVAPNLTSHADGLAEYSDADLAGMITRGQRPDGAPMMPPMPYRYLAKMTGDDLSALILYLRPLPPLPDAETGGS